MPVSPERLPEKLIQVICLAMAVLCFTVSAGANANTYLIGENDILLLAIIAGGETQSRVELVVSEQGQINVPFIGRVDAAGLSLSRLEEKIREPLAINFFVDPEVHLQIKEYHSLQYFISGAVKNPGLYKLGFNPTLMDLLARAGGTLPERGSIAYILKGTGAADISHSRDLESLLSRRKTRQIDLNQLLDEGDMSENISLESGDTIYIPLSKKLDQSYSNIYVDGEVKRPGVFEFQPGLTALAACIMAGGFDQYAAPARARIIRKRDAGQEVIKINLNRVIRGELADVPLQPGDRIHIPESWL